MIQNKLEKKDAFNALVLNIFISLYFFITYFEPYLNNVLGSVIKYYMFVVIVVVLITSKHLTVHGYHYAIIGWLFYKFLSLLWTTDYTTFKTHYVSHLGVVALLVCITALPEDENRNKWIQLSLWLGSFCIGVLSLFFSKDFEGEQTNRQVLELFGYQNDPNNQSAFLLFGVAISLYYLLYEKKHRLLHIAVIGINSYATLLTASRAGLLSLFVIAFGYIITLFDKEKFKTNYKRFFGLAILIIAASILIFTLLPKEVSERLFDFDGYEGGNNRDGLWGHGLSIIKNPLFFLLGSGWGAFVTGRGALSLHNTFLSTLCDVGLLGFMLLFGTTASAVIKSLKKKNVLPFAVFIAGMVPSFFIEAINKRFFWNAIMFVFIVYNQYLQPESESKSNNSRSRYRFRQ